MDLLHPAAFVRFGALGQTREEAAEVLPRGFAEEDLAGRVVGAEEGPEEGVEVVGGGGKVKPGWGEEGVDVCVEGGHTGDGGGRGDEGGAEDADGGGGHGDLDGVVDVWRDG